MRVKISTAIFLVASGWLGHLAISNVSDPDELTIPAPVVPPLEGPEKVQRAERLEIVAPDGTVGMIMWIDAASGRSMISVKDGKNMKVIDLAKAARWMH